MYQTKQLIEFASLNAPSSGDYIFTQSVSTSAVSTLSFSTLAETVLTYNQKVIDNFEVTPDSYDIGYDIVLCAGQSNMTGRGVYDSLVDLTSERILQFGGSASSDPRYSTIYLAQDSLSHAQSISASYFSGVWHIGPSMTFARNYISQIPPTRRVLLVPCGWGATSLVSGKWSPSAGAPTGSCPPSATLSSQLVNGALYENAISQANKAIAAAQVEYPNSRFVGTLWLQGENDGANNVSQNAYAAELDNLINGFRNRINGASDSWFIIGQMLPEAITANASYVPIDNAHIDTLQRNSKIGLALNVAGQSNGDNLHYNATGLHIIGRRMAEAVKPAKHNVSGSEPVPPSLAPTVTPSVGSATVCWVAPLCRATDFIIAHRQSPSGAWDLSTNMGSPYRKITISGLSAGVHDFAVFTINELGTSSMSRIATATIL
jgi:hypothetical protein